MPSRSSAASATLRAIGPATPSPARLASPEPAGTRPRDGFTPDEAARRGRDADRPAAVRAGREGQHPGCHGRRGSPARAARPERRVPRVPRRRAGEPLGVRRKPELGRRALAEAHGAGRVDRQHELVGVVRHEVRERARAEPRGHARPDDAGPCRRAACPRAARRSARAPRRGAPVRSPPRASPWRRRRSPRRAARCGRGSARASSTGDTWRRCSSWWSSRAVYSCSSVILRAYGRCAARHPLGYLSDFCSSTVPSQRSNLKPTRPMRPISTKPNFSCRAIDASAPWSAMTAMISFRPAAFDRSMSSASRARPRPLPAAAGPEVDRVLDGVPVGALLLPRRDERVAEQLPARRLGHEERHAELVQVGELRLPLAERHRVLVERDRGVRDVVVVDLAHGGHVRGPRVADRVLERAPRAARACAGAGAARGAAGIPPRAWRQTTPPQQSRDADVARAASGRQPPVDGLAALRLEQRVGPAERPRAEEARGSPTAGSDAPTR